MRLTDREQFKVGKESEAFLDRFFRERGFWIEILSDYEERVLHLGDRRFYKDGQSYCVEYKFDDKTYKTNNIFLETISVDTQGTPGWVYTCRADYIFYVANGKVLIFRPVFLRSKIETLKRLFRTVKTHSNLNTGYNTHGVLVRLIFAEVFLAERVIKIGDFGAK